MGEGPPPISDGKEIGGAAEPGPFTLAAQLSARLIGDTIPAATFIGLHGALGWWLRWTRQEREWWAPVAMDFLVACFLITLICVLGSEAFITSWGAVARAIQRVKRR